MTSKKGFSERLKSKYRVVVVDDKTFEEKTSVVLTPLNIFVFLGTVVITFITILIYVVAFTPLREYIPGYADTEVQKKLYSVTLRADSLENNLRQKDDYIKKIRNVISGNFPVENMPPQRNAGDARFDTIASLRKSKDDSILRSQIENPEQFDLAVSEEKPFSEGISNFFYFTPVRGTVVNTFDPAEKHFGIDIVGPPNEAIKAALEGSVVMASWTPEDGYVMGIQHAGNLISLYKHNSVLLKKTGAYVKAGEAIAIIGDSGEHTTGPHLHFELWHDGNAVNPSDFIAF